jgi:predicted amidophosphoribosyltransferase
MPQYPDLLSRFSGAEVWRGGSLSVKTVLVMDDVCTTGGQLDAIAGCLFEQGGAAQVEGVVLARAPWRGSG